MKDYLGKVGDNFHLVKTKNKDEKLSCKNKRWKLHDEEIMETIKTTMTHPSRYL